jgi:hypothetical protein
MSGLLAGLVFAQVAATPATTYVPAPNVRRSTLSIAAGAFYNRIYSAQAYGGEGLVAFGSNSMGTGWETAFQYSQGRTEHGLNLYKGRLSLTYDWIADRFRVGIGPTLGYLALDRATTGGAQKLLLVGLDGHVSFDFVKTSSYSAFFVSLGIKVEGGTWGPSLLLGFRGDGGELMTTPQRPAEPSKPAPQPPAGERRGLWPR